MMIYSNKYDNVFPMCFTIFINQMDHILDEDRTAWLYSFNNNNANFSLYICNIHFELAV